MVHVRGGAPHRHRRSHHHALRCVENRYRAADGHGCPRGAQPTDGQLRPTVRQLGQGYAVRAQVHDPKPGGVHGRDGARVVDGANHLRRGGLHGSRRSRRHGAVEQGDVHGAGRQGWRGVRHTVHGERDPLRPSRLELGGDQRRRVRRDQPARVQRVRCKRGGVLQVLSQQALRELRERRRGDCRRRGYPQELVHVRHGADHAQGWGQRVRPEDGTRGDVDHRGHARG